MISNSKKIFKKYLKERSKDSKKAFRIFSILIIFLSIILYGSLKTQAMSSTNYTIPKDSINVGGAETGTSANYDMPDTIGEVGSGLGSSATYDLDAGFRPEAKKPLLQFSISTNNISLGVLSTISVSSGNTVTTVSTNARSGYSTSVTADGNLRKDLVNIISDVIDGSVTAGSSEYGIRTSGVDGLFNATDTSVTNVPKNIASSASSVNNRNTTIDFKASISGSESPGQYNQKVTIICTGNF